MKNKLLATLMLVVMLFSTMVACGKKPNVSNEALAEQVNAGYDGSEVTIKFYHTMGKNLTVVLDQYLVEFNKIYPKITVEYESVGGYDDVRDQIATEINEGLQPNIAYCYPDHVALFNMSKAVQPLDVFIDSTNPDIALSDAQKDDFIKGYYEEGRQFGDGKMYTMPFSKSTEVLYYNKTFFAEHGLQVPTTWDEMEALCKRIKEIDAEIYKDAYAEANEGKGIDPQCVPLGYDSEANWFITMCEQLKTPYTSPSGEKFLFNNAENKAFVKKFREWYTKGYVTTQDIVGAYTSGLFIEQDPTKPHSYMSIGSSAGATHQRPSKVDNEYPFEVGIASIPQADANNKKVISQGPSVCIFKKNNIQEVIASWLLVKYLTTSTLFQASFADASGYVPVLKSVGSYEPYATLLAKADGYDNVAYLSAKVCLEQQAYYYTSPAFVGSSAARDQVGALIQKCFTGVPADGQTLDQFIDAAFEDAIDECKYQAGE